MIVINKSTLKKTIWCTKNFKCLNKGNPCDCRITSSVKGESHFVNCSENNCTYKMNFGNGIICNCPTRKELYNKYGI